jgi:hypothetical protein
MRTRTCRSTAFVGGQQRWLGDVELAIAMPLSRRKTKSPVFFLGGPRASA